MTEFLGPLSVWSTLVLFAAVFGCIELGRFLGRWRRAAYSEQERAGTGVVEGALFAFVGLLLAFSFAGAMQRWDVRRDLVVSETNAIGTAWLRIDLLPAESQPKLRELFRAYTDARISVFESLPDLPAVQAEIARANSLQGEIWAYAVAECLRPDGEKARVLLLPALNEMIDITTTRTMSLMSHPPVVIHWLLISLVLVSSLMAGFAMSPTKTQRWLHVLAFTTVMTAGVYIVLDLEYPRTGLIRLEWVDQFMIELRQSMK